MRTMKVYIHVVGTIIHLQHWSAGLRPGMLQKYNAATSASQKFEFIRAFMLDPAQLSSITIEAFYEELARKEESENRSEVPLFQLRKIYVSPGEQKFLEENIVQKQSGRAHPQDPNRTNPEMVLYWHFTENTDQTKNRRDIGHKAKAVGEVPLNRAALGAVDSSLQAAAAGFAGKGGGKNQLGDQFPAPPGAEPKRLPKQKKEKKVTCPNLKPLTKVIK